MYGAETWTLRKVDQKCLESFETWCWNSWSERVRNDEVLHRIKEERNILHAIKGRRANCIGRVLRRNCLLKYFVAGKIEGRIEVTGR